MMDAELVRPAFARAVSRPARATNLIPSPNSTEMAIHIGHKRAGWPGLLGRLSLSFEPQNRTPASTNGLSHAKKKLMLGRVAVSLTLIVAMVIAGASVSSTCASSNAPNQKACASPCCATKPCCAMSEKPNTESIPPFTTSTSSQQNFIASAPVVSDVPIAPPAATDRLRWPLANVQWHSPETLALLCIRLI